MDFLIILAQSTNTIYGISFKKCKRECFGRPACGAVDFNRNYHRCLLLSRDLDTSGNFSGKPGSFQRPEINNSPPLSNQSIFILCDGNETCVTTGCQLPQVSNGVIYGNIMQIGTNIQIVCDSGFHPFKNETSATCDHNGTWTLSLQCVVSFDCGPPPDIPNTDVEMTSFFVAQYSCNSGFQQVGHDNITTCRAPDGWNDISMSCLRMCGEPPILPNTVVSYAPNIEGNIRRYSCLDGFSTQTGMASDTSTCGSDGNWTDVDLICLTGCGALPSITNGFFSSGDDTVGSVRQYDCNEDHTNVGQRKGALECSPQGTWEPSGPVNCKALESLGQYCSNDGYCTEPNTTCFKSWCTCKPLYKYSFADDYCFKSCDTVLDTFTQINQTYIGWYWTDELKLSNHQTCESECIADPTCLIYEHLHAHAQDCRIGTLSLQQFQDTLPDDIDYDYTSSKLFVRNCEPINPSGSSG